MTDFVTWERGTLQPKYGIDLGVEYTHTIGVAELYDYEWFFARLPPHVRRCTTADVSALTKGDSSSTSLVAATTSGTRGISSSPVS